MTIHSLHPESRVRLTKRGVNVTIRYPVDMHHAREMDDRINREMLTETVLTETDKIG